MHYNIYISFGYYAIVFIFCIIYIYIYTQVIITYIQAVLTRSQLTNLAKLALWHTNALSIYNVGSRDNNFETPITLVLLVTIKNQCKIKRAL